MKKVWKFSFKRLIIFSPSFCRLDENFGTEGVKLRATQKSNCHCTQKCKKQSLYNRGCEPCQSFRTKSSILLTFISPNMRCILLHWKGIADIFCVDNLMRFGSNLPIVEQIRPIKSVIRIMNQIYLRKTKGVQDAAQLKELVRVSPALALSLTQT